MDMEALEISGVMAITVICYLAGAIVKAVPRSKKQLVPIVCGLLGGLLGIAGMYLIADFPAQDPITAAEIGIVSGLAATGVNQIGKHLKKKEEV